MKKGYYTLFCLMITVNLVFAAECRDGVFQLPRDSQLGLDIDEPYAYPYAVRSEGTKLYFSCSGDVYYPLDGRRSRFHWRLKLLRDMPNNVKFQPLSKESVRHNVAQLRLAVDNRFWRVEYLDDHWQAVALKTEEVVRQANVGAQLTVCGENEDFQAAYDLKLGEIKETYSVDLTDLDRYIHSRGQIAGNLRTRLKSKDQVALAERYFSILNGRLQDKTSDSEGDILECLYRSLNRKEDNRRLELFQNYQGSNQEFANLRSHVQTGINKLQEIHGEMKENGRRLVRNRQKMAAYTERIQQEQSLLDQQRAIYQANLEAHSVFGLYGVIMTRKSELSLNEADRQLRDSLREFAMHDLAPAFIQSQTRISVDGSSAKSYFEDWIHEIKSGIVNIRASKDDYFPISGHWIGIKEAKFVPAPVGPTTPKTELLDLVSKIVTIRTIRDVNFLAKSPYQLQGDQFERIKAAITTKLQGLKQKNGRLDVVRQQAFQAFLDSTRSIEKKIAELRREREEEIEQKPRLFAHLDNTLNLAKQQHSDIRTLTLQMPEAKQAVKEALERTFKVTLYEFNNAFLGPNDNTNAITLRLVADTLQTMNQRFFTVRETIKTTVRNGMFESMEAGLQEFRKSFGAARIYQDEDILDGRNLIINVVVALEAELTPTEGLRFRSVLSDPSPMLDRLYTHIQETHRCLRDGNMPCHEQWEVPKSPFRSAAVAPPDSPVAPVQPLRQSCLPDQCLEIEGRLFLISRLEDEVLYDQIAYLKLTPTQAAEQERVADRSWRLPTVDEMRAAVVVHGLHIPAFDARGKCFYVAGELGPRQTLPCVRILEKDIKRAWIDTQDTGYYMPVSQ